MIKALSIVRAACKSLADVTAHHTPSAAERPGCRGAPLWGLFFVFLLDVWFGISSLGDGGLAYVTCTFCIN